MFYTDILLNNTVQQESHRLGVGTLFNKCKLVFTKDMLVDETGVSKDLGVEVINRVLCDTANSELESIVSGDIRYMYKVKAKKQYRSAFRRLARRRAKMLCLARTSRDRGSMPF